MVSNVDINDDYVPGTRGESQNNNERLHQCQPSAIHDKSNTSFEVHADVPSFVQIPNEVLPEYAQIRCMTNRILSRILSTLPRSLSLSIPQTLAAVTTSAGLKSEKHAVVRLLLPVKAPFPETGSRIAVARPRSWFSTQFQLSDRPFPVGECRRRHEIPRAAGKPQSARNSSHKVRSPCPDRAPARIGSEQNDWHKHASVRAHGAGPFRSAPRVRARGQHLLSSEGKGRPHGPFATGPGSRTASAIGARKCQTLAIVPIPTSCHAFDVEADCI